MGDGGAADDEAVFGIGPEGDTLERGADEGGVEARGRGAVVGDAAAFGGAVEIVQLDAGFGEDGFFEFERQRCAGGDGKAQGGGKDFVLVPETPKGGNGGEGELAVVEDGTAKSFG